MQLDEFDFPFDPELVASQPLLPRDRARMLVLDRPTGQLTHRQIADLPTLLQRGDLLVVNDTKVIPARVMGRKQPGNRPVEVLFVKAVKDDVWEILVKGKFREGDVILFGGGARATIIRRGATGTQVQVESALPVPQWLREQGDMPLPPYIKRAATPDDRYWYQTLFAKHEGAIAAPTAGLHFTPQLLSQLAAQGIGMAAVTLHVGPGTFKPVSAARIEDHEMGEEAFEIGASAAQAIVQTKQAGGRVVAVGTTVVRALETAAQERGAVVAHAGASRLFITPGFRFQVVDALVTNFHLPRTTLLMLVSAFAGIQRVRGAYEEAVRERYRFYSYGDAMLIL
jgi:S-adenosylmethionine:tRNA ribosyltransferase-isomerase